MARTQDGGMATMEKHDIAQLERHVQNLGTAMERLHNRKEFDDLIAHLHRPGWTTPAEFIFATGIVESMLAHTNALSQLKVQLLHGSSLVGR